MPHDINGKKLNVGDIVTVKFHVTAVQVGEHYCNITAETIEPMFPGEHKTTVTFNGKQVEAKEPTEAASIEFKGGLKELIGQNQFPTAEPNGAQ